MPNGIDRNLSRRSKSATSLVQSWLMMDLSGQGLQSRD
jgi:hypothetical protein